MRKHLEIRIMESYKNKSTLAKSQPILPRKSPAEKYSFRHGRASKKPLLRAFFSLRPQAKPSLACDKIASSRPKRGIRDDKCFLWEK
jgi:hypothetical protein